MPDEAAFLQAIRANAEDDGLRLVYSDWLEERGDFERAEFIRLQIELSRLDPDDPVPAAKQRREGELLEKRGKEWEAPAKKLVPAYDSARGFVDWARLDAATPLDRMPALLAMTPLRRLRIVKAGPRIAEAASS